MASNYSKYKYGVNDLETWCLTNGEWGQQLLEEWDYEENIKHGICLEPREFTYASHKKVWWKCKTCGRSWDATILHRTFTKSACVKCYDDSRQGIKTREKDTSKTSLYDWCNTETDDFKQRLLVEYTGYDENDNYIDIKEITRASKRKMKWKCIDCGHEWIASVKNRTIHSSGCSTCSAKSTSYQEQVLYWSLKSIWNNTESRAKLFKNIDNRGIEFDIYVPETEKFKGLCIEYGSTKWHKDKQERDAYKRQLCEEHKINFIEIIEDSFDELEHKYEEDYICFKMNYTNQDEQLKEIIRRILKRYDLSDENIDYPEIFAKAWNYSHGEIEEEKQLSTLYPELVKEIHPTLNGNLKPEKITVASGKRIYWQCQKCNHGKNGEWISGVYSRTIQKSGCPKCGYNWYKVQTGQPQKIKAKKEVHTFSISQFV